MRMRLSTAAFSPATSATFDADRGLTLSGRVSSFVNVAGRKVQPEEVERALREFPGVIDAACARHGRSCTAASSSSPAWSSRATARQCSSCAASAAGRLAAHKIPRAFVFVDEIPLTARGKTDRERLRALAAERDGRAPVCYSPASI